MNNHLHNENDENLSWSENPEIFQEDTLEQGPDKNGVFIALIKAFSMMLLASALLIFVGIAWFTMNKNIGTQGMGVTVPSELFEIEVQGDYKENDTLIDKMNTAIFGSGSGVDAYSDGMRVDIEHPYYQTTASKNKIIWRKAVQDAEHGHYDAGLEPNSGGKMEFWVVAKEAGTIDPVFCFDVNGFHAVTHSESQSGSIVDVVDDLFVIDSSLGDHSDVDPTLTPEMVNKKMAAQSFIRGHILFFRGRDSDGYYSGFLGADRKFRLSDVYPEAGGTTFTKGEKKKVTVYWKWANTFEQMIYDSSYSSYSPLLRDAVSADRTALYEYMLPSNSNMFLGLTDSQITEKLTTVRTSGEGYAQAVTDLSNAYNDADQEIGDMVHYIQIEMTVDDN